MLRKLLTISLILIATTVAFLLLPSFKSYSLEFNPTITINPDLNISRFAPYNIYATNVPDQSNLTSLTLDIKTLNGNTVETECWDYKVDGTCDSQTKHLTMTYDEGDLRWESENIYPDYIYPEVYFASSTITWNNLPQNISVRRGNYHIFHMTNPYDMVGDMSFWIEFNAVPLSEVNSADLQVYIVKNNIPLSFFNSDWRDADNPSMELVGTKTKTDTFNHTHHVTNSSHHLVSLSTDANGKIGTKALDITGDFWIVLYSNSPNVARGWNLRYQPTSLCTNSNRWYIGNQSGWTTTYQNGCPDAHIHIARETDNMDSVQATLIGTYNDLQTYEAEEIFAFGEIPNLPPNNSSFINPTGLGTYEGDLTISWNPATDANGSAVTYTIDLLDSNGDFLQNLETDTSNTSTLLDTTGLDDGEYSLKGEVCDDGLPSEGDPVPLCVEFYLGSNFYIDNTDPIYSLSSISITSSNSINNDYAKAGDVITLTFVSTGDISDVTVNFYSAGVDITNSETVTEGASNTWTAIYTISSSDTDGLITFDLTSPNLDLEYIETTDDSSVIVDKTTPPTPTASPVAGTYTTSKSVVLSSSGATIIKYTTNGDSPTCTSGTTYSSAISISETTTIKAIACDQINNASGVSTFVYTINISEEEEDNEEDNNYYYSSSNDSEDEDTTLEEEIVIEDDQTGDVIEDSENNKYISYITRRNGATYLSTIKIKIVDKQGNPIPNLLVTLNSEPKEGTTDIQGIATFNNILTGVHTVSFKYNNRNYAEEIKIEEPNEEEQIELDIITIVANKHSNSWIIWLVIIIFIIIIGTLTYKKYRKNLQS